jgi:hypothetical protein
LIEQFRTTLEERGISDRVHVLGSSHLGGHRFAGTLVIYPGANWARHFALQSPLTSEAML